MLIQEIEHNELDDLVFEDRNKAYGAYTLRRSYYVNLQIALAVSVSVMFGVVFFYYLKQKFMIDPPLPAEDKLEMVMEEIEIPEMTPPPPPPPPSVEEKKAITQAFTEPVVVKKDEVDTVQVPDQKQLDSAAIAVSTNKGDTLVENPLPGDPGSPGGTGPVDDQIYYSVDGTSASFPGGNNEMVQYLSKGLANSMTRAKKLGDKGIVYVSFVIEKDGSISNVVVQRGLAVCQTCNDEAKELIENMPQWVPAENKQGHRVRQHFRIPINFTF